MNKLWPRNSMTSTGSACHRQQDTRREAAPHVALRFTSTHASASEATRDGARSDSSIVRAIDTKSASQGIPPSPGAKRHTSTSSAACLTRNGGLCTPSASHSSGSSLNGRVGNPSRASGSFVLPMAPIVRRKPRGAAVRRPARRCCPCNQQEASGPSTAALCLEPGSGAMLAAPPKGDGMWRSKPDLSQFFVLTFIISCDTACLCILRGAHRAGVGRTRRACGLGPILEGQPVSEGECA